MRFARRIAAVLCVVFMAALFNPARAAEVQDPVLVQYASEFSQYTNLKYFKPENTGRYIGYKTIHSDLDWETVVTYVNIGLDRLFYSDTTVVAEPGATNALVNKYHPLPPDYVPAKLETISPKYSAGTMRLTHDARVAFEKLCADAKKLGFSLYALSSYRSYSSQKAVYDSFYDPGNPASAFYQELRAARPGFSEHQTGLAVDIAQTSGPLAGSAVNKWYTANAHLYGFIVRYPFATEPILGYSNEPWHLRYLGVDLATAVYESGLTYDEYYAREIDIPDRNGETFAVGVTAADAIAVNGTPFQLSIYDILGTSYFRLRDIAAVLNDTPMLFDITWDADNSRTALLPGTPYSGDPALLSLEAGAAVALTAVAPPMELGESAYAPAGYAVNGSTYYTLEDILALLGAHAEDDGAGGFVILPGLAPSPSSSPSPSPSPSPPPSPPPYL
jgi:D-alanyl-D-alanine carboxypeptidase